MRRAGPGGGVRPPGPPAKGPLSFLPTPNSPQQPGGPESQADEFMRKFYFKVGPKVWGKLHLPL